MAHPPAGLPMAPSFLPMRPASDPSTSSPVQNRQPTVQRVPPASSASFQPHTAFQPAQASQISMGSGIPYQTGYMYPQAVPIPYYQAPTTLRQAFFQPPVYQTYNDAGYAYSAAYLAEQAGQSSAPPLPTPPQSTRAPAAVSSQPVRPQRNAYPAYTNPSNTRDRPPPTSAPPSKKPRINAPTNTTDPDRGPWRNCAEAGCAFVGPEKDVEIHEEDRHLIFKAGRTVVRTEEEEEMAQLKKAGIFPSIQGTSITLRTEEDIAKWIAQRKARFPTAAKIAEKEKERAERMERGEPDVGYGGRGRGRGRGAGPRERGGGRGGRGGFVSGKEPDFVETKPAVDSGYGARGGVTRGRGGRGMYGNMEWTRPGLEIKREVDAKQEENKFGVGGGSESDYNDSDDDGIEGKKGKDGDRLTLDALKALIQDYGSGDDDEEDAAMGEEEHVPKAEEMDSSMADESSVTRAVTSMDNHQAAPSDAPICKYFARNGRCVHGDACRFQHIRPERRARENDGQSRLNKPIQDKLKQPKEPKDMRVIGAFQQQVSRPSLLGALLQQPISATLSHLTQAIQFLVENEFLDNVELVPGQAEEEQKKREKVVEIEVVEEMAAEALEVSEGEDVPGSTD